MSAEGRVLEVSEDTVKLHLAADETQDIATAFPFRIACPYTAEGQTGWHVMPEKGEYASLYFPADDEGGAYVRLQSARRAGPGNEKHEHPAIKRFETVHGNEMKFSPDTLSFARPRSGNLIRMTDSGGVEIYSADTLQIRAGEKAGFACKTLNAVAGRSMRLGGKTATLIVDEILHLKG
jgi:hypothetical protein